MTHIFSRGAKIAYMFWQRYEYTQDEAWLRERAYPMLRGVAEFYRNFPNTIRGDDGKYHIHHVNSNESVRDVSDTDEEIASMRGIFPALIRASEILDVDAEMRPVWQEFLDNLAPLPRSDHPEPWRCARRAERRGRDGGGGRRRRDAPTTTARLDSRRCRRFAAAAPAGPTATRCRCGSSTCARSKIPTRRRMRLANATLDGYGGRGGGVLSKVGVTKAMMGRADAVRTMIPATSSPRPTGRP